VGEGSLEELRAQFSDRKDPIENVAMWKLQEICRRFMDITHGTNWHYMLPEQWTPGVRWIWFLAMGELELAEEMIKEIEDNKNEAVKEREAAPEPRSYSTRVRPEY
jgi:hypothetical protein